MSAPQKVRPYLTVKEMCQILGVGRDRLMKLINDGEIKASRVGKGKFAPIRFDPDEPRRYLDANRIKPVSASA